jgi:3-oxoacyl-[acyl-carrier protein] reductase
VIGDRSPERASALAEEARREGAEALAVPLDVTSEGSAGSAVESALSSFGRIDVLVNDAHLWLGLKRDDTTPAYLEEVLRENGLAAWIMSRAVVPHMRARRSGKIVNLSSIGAWVSSPAYLAAVETTGNLPSFGYALSRVLVNGLTRFMAQTLGPSGITVNALAVGMILSEGTRRQLTAEERQTFVDRTALRRMLEIRDTDGAFLFLASSDSDLVTGQVLIVDGGLVMISG